MTREEAIDRLRKISEKTPIRTNGDDLVAITMAIQALSQEPTDDATLKDIFCMGCEYKDQQPCDDAISRQNIIDTYKSCADMLNDEELKGADLVMEWVNNAPSVTQKSGKWHRKYDRIVNELYWECNKCGEGFQLTSNFCPNCGAKMVEPQESEG